MNNNLFSFLGYLLISHASPYFPVKFCYTYILSQEVIVYRKVPGRTKNGPFICHLLIWIIKRVYACAVDMLQMAACIVNVKHRGWMFLPAVVRHSSSSLLSWQLSWPLHKKLRSTQLPFRHLKRVSEHNSGLPVNKESGQRTCQQCQNHKRHGNHLWAFVSVFWCQIHFNKT